MLLYKMLFRTIEKKASTGKIKIYYKVLTECEIMYLMGSIWFRFWTWGNINSFVSAATTKNKRLYMVSFFHQKSFDPLIPLFWLKLLLSCSALFFKVISHKLSIKWKIQIALRIRSDPGNRHKDQRHVIAKKIPISCADARVEIRYVVQTHIF